MATHERPTEQPQKPSVKSLRESIGAIEQDLLEGNFDWALIQPTPNLLHIRKELTQWLQEDNPTWNKTLVVNTAARIETSWKVARLEQLSQMYGEADERVQELQEDIDYWRALLNPPQPPKNR
jgi:hypothetical protein